MRAQPVPQPNSVFTQVRTTIQCSRQQALAGLPPMSSNGSIGAVFWQLGYDTIYSYTDRSDDVKLGLRSTATCLGEMAASGSQGLLADDCLLDRCWRCSTERHALHGIHVCDCHAILCPVAAVRARPTRVVHRNFQIQPVHRPTAAWGRVDWPAESILIGSRACAPGTLKCPALFKSSTAQCVARCR